MASRPPPGSAATAAAAAAAAAAELGAAVAAAAAAATSAQAAAAADLAIIKAIKEALPAASSSSEEVLVEAVEETTLQAADATLAKASELRLSMRPLPVKGERRKGVSAEAASSADGGPNDVSMTFEKHDKSEAVREVIAKATTSSAVFAALNDAQRNDVATAMREMKFQSGDTVIKQGDVGDNFYVVESGSYSVYLSQAGAEPVAAYYGGGTFGELALMYNCPRAASVICKEPGSCWALEHSAFRAIVMAANRGAVDANASFLKSVGLLSPLTDEQRAVIGSVLELIEYGPGETVVQQGDPADALFLVQSGELAVFQAEGDEPKGMEIGLLKQPEFFGEKSLEKEGEVELATIATVSHVKLLKLMRSHFTDLLGSLRDVIKFNFNKKVLVSMSIFSELSESEKSMLTESLVERTFEPEQPIIKQGEIGTAFYIIKSGSVRVTRKDDAGTEVVVKGKLVSCMPEMVA